MTASSDRRTFLQASAALAVGGLGFLDALPAVAADDAKLDPELVRLDADIEPLVRLLEDTPRQQLLEEVGARVKKGLAYRDVLAALLLAGVRNIKPRPNVGFKFHAVMVVNSAHQAALAGPDKERWLSPDAFWLWASAALPWATAVSSNGDSAIRRPFSRMIRMTPNAARRKA